MLFERVEEKKGVEATSTFKHPDAPKNLEYTVHRLKQYMIHKGLQIIFEDKNAKGVIFDPKAVIFSWKKGVATCGMPISFHKELGVFKREIDLFLGDCIRYGWIKMKSVELLSA